MDNIKKILSIFTLISFVTGALFVDNSFSQDTKTIVVLLSGDIQPYKDALAGFKEGMKPTPYLFVYKEFMLSAEARGNEAIKKEIDTNVPDLIFAVGTEASLFAKADFRETPVVFTMVLNPVGNGVVDSMDKPGGNLTGVCLDIPTEAQFMTIKKILPSVRRIGMLYDASKRETLREEADKAAAKIGLELVSRPVREEKEIAQALKEVLAGSDCLWASVDPLIYNSQTAQNVILSTLRERKPFMAFSVSFVKAGALFSLECDYFDIGAQTCREAIKVLDGEKAGSIPVSVPRKTFLAVNARTAGVMGIDMESEALRKADKVFGKE